jgi:Na+-driven multidrug efflux pump
VPVVWLVLAVALLAGPPQRLILSMFTEHGDTLLHQELKGLLQIVAVLELLDWLQTVMTGSPLSSSVSFQVFSSSRAALGSFQV